MAATLVCGEVAGLQSSGWVNILVCIVVYPATHCVDVYVGIWRPAWWHGTPTGRRYGQAQRGGWLVGNTARHSVGCLVLGCTEGLRWCDRDLSRGALSLEPRWVQISVIRWMDVMLFVVGSISV